MGSCSPPVSTSSECLIYFTSNMWINRCSTDVEVTDVRVCELTESSVSVALKFFSSIPSSTASVSRCSPFRIRTRLPAGMSNICVDAFCTPQPQTAAKTSCAVLFTWRRNHCLHVVLVQLEFVPGVDKLHHRCVLVSHLLRHKQKRRRTLNAQTKTAQRGTNH